MNDLAVIPHDQIILPTAQFTPVGWQPNGELSHDEWLEVGRTLACVADAVNWWIGDWLRYGTFRSWGDKFIQARQIFGNKYELATLREIQRVSKKVNMDNRLSILSWTHHREVAQLDAESQALLLDHAIKSRLSVHELRLAVLEYQRNQIAPSFPQNGYRVIYADPPWRYEYSKANNRAIENHYPTLDLGEICLLPVSEIAIADSVLFLWATSPKLAESLQVMEAWGFVYRTCLVWDKEVIGMGYYGRQQHELLLIGTRGEPGVPDPADRPASVIRERRQEHSAKPVQFYELIERMYPHASKIELFARNARQGWDAWGNQAYEAAP